MQDYFNSNLKNEENFLLKKIENYEVVSFDIYDTLVLRNVCEPKDIFKIVEFEINKKNNKKIDFFKDRILFEEKVRANSSKEDIVLDEIYLEFEKKYGKLISDYLKKTELEIEEKFTIRNEVIYKVYKKSLEEKKKIFFISDMYLPSDYLKKLLKKLGYLEYEELYISGEKELTKSSGNLFKYVRENKKISNSWIHIGDNFYSDCLMAEKNSIDYIHYKNISEREKIENKSLESSIINGIIQNKLYTEELGYWERFGIKAAFPIYFSLVKELIKRIPENEEIYFFSRDGYIIKKIYNLFRKKNTRYLYTSRKVYQFSNLVNSNFDDLFKTITEYNIKYTDGIKINEILDNLEINYDEVKVQLKEYNLTLDTKLKLEDGSLEKSKGFFQSIEKLIRKKIKVERELLKKYLFQERINEKKKINIFDIGWRGSIQSSLAEYTDNKIQGFYFGTSDSLIKNIENNAIGLIFHKNLPRNISAKILNNLMIYELIFSAPEGSLVGFKEENEKIIPILDNVEENEEIYNIINKFQNSALEIIKEIMKYSFYLENYKLQESIENLEKILENKDIEDLLNFSVLTNNVGIGKTKHIEKYVLCYNIEEYLKNKKEIDEKIQTNLWKNAILIKDLKERYFNKKEIELLYNLKEKKMCFFKVKKILRKINRYTVKRGILYIRKNGVKSLYYKLKNF